MGWRSKSAGGGGGSRSGKSRTSRLGQSVTIAQAQQVLDSYMTSLITQANTMPSNVGNVYNTVLETFQRAGVVIDPATLAAAQTYAQQIAATVLPPSPQASDYANLATLGAELFNEFQSMLGTSAIQAGVISQNIVVTGFTLATTINTLGCGFVAAHPDIVSTFQNAVAVSKSGVVLNNYQSGVYDQPTHDALMAVSKMSGFMAASVPDACVAPPAPPAPPPPPPPPPPPTVPTTTTTTATTAPAAQATSPAVVWLIGGAIVVVAAGAIWAVTREGKRR